MAVANAARIVALSALLIGHKPLDKVLNYKKVPQHD